MSVRLKEATMIIFQLVGASLLVLFFAPMLSGNTHERRE